MGGWGSGAGVVRFGINTALTAAAIAQNESKHARDGVVHKKN
jgi:hypothetical protein